ncbi:uncharacterized protein DDB_G0290685-like [Chenopodium quinoa]|uniref:uncharacterized protein DDB_G0290685-like n=1 Tax=Chenopodium quinoa TaxID=63459 RepID=UPI000B778CCD|nr:uncharacterized protein DDB_G0290685-like [Chenopodium quinoa]
MGKRLPSGVQILHFVGGDVLENIHPRVAADKNVENDLKARIDVLYAETDAIRASREAKQQELSNFWATYAAKLEEVQVLHREIWKIRDKRLAKSIDKLMILSTVIHAVERVVEEQGVNVVGEDAGNEGVNLQGRADPIEENIVGEGDIGMGEAYEEENANEDGDAQIVEDDDGEGNEDGDSVHNDDCENDAGGEHSVDGNDVDVEHDEEVGQKVDAEYNDVGDGVNFGVDDDDDDIGYAEEDDVQESGLDGGDKDMDHNAQRYWSDANSDSSLDSDAYRRTPRNFDRIG